MQNMKYSEMLPDYSDVLKPSDLMQILHIGRNTVYNYLSDGTIRSFRIAGQYRIPKGYLLEYIYPDIVWNE